MQMRYLVSHVSFLAVAILGNPLPGEKDGQILPHWRYPVHMFARNGNSTNEPTSSMIKTTSSAAEAVGIPTGTSSTSASYKSALYFPNWDIYGRNYQPQDLPAENLTHVLYAFANIRPDTGEVYLSDTYADIEKHYPTDSWNDVGTNVYGCVKQLYLLKKKWRHLKVILSIGGWTYGPNFAAPASTANGRAMFASSALNLLKNFGFDGLDLDWEFPANRAQGNDFVLLLQETRNALNNYSSALPEQPHFLLTVAAPAGPQNYHHFNVSGMDPFLDFWNLMAYDYAGSWSNVSGHQANLFVSKDRPESTPFSTDNAVKYYTRHGVSPAKMLLGMPLYGRAFTDTVGPGTSFSGVGGGSWENGIWDYKSLPMSNVSLHYDADAGASWSYDESTRTMISYDTPQAVTRKVQYMRDEGLGGAMWWEANGDNNATDKSLVNLVTDQLGKRLEDSINVLAYPDSEYDNLRKGMQGD